MLTGIRRLAGQAFRKTRTINNEPLNKFSLIVVILIDIFILFNVFSGLDDISRWHLSPDQVYPCYSEWQDYRSQTTGDKEYAILQRSLPDYPSQPSVRKTYLQVEAGHLGRVDETCLQYADYQDKLRTADNQKLVKTIDQKQQSISNLEQSNQNIRSQYDSTLLEKIAGQPRERSLNTVSAEKAKQQFEANNLKIAELEKDVADLKRQLIQKTESINFLNWLKNDSQFKDVERGYRQAAFWYPSIQITFQAIFLLPLILITLTIHRAAQRRNYGLISLITWHLLVIFFIPLVIKIFEFLQVGVLFSWIFDIVGVLLGGLLFLVSYVYILLIPLLGFGIIKFFQRFFIPNPKLQVANRVQTLSCIKCAKKLRQQDNYCPHCGYYQYVECPHCHSLTYKYLSYCKHCGLPQDDPS